MLDMGLAKEFKAVAALAKRFERLAACLFGSKVWFSNRGQVES